MDALFIKLQTSKNETLCSQYNIPKISDNCLIFGHNETLFTYLCSQPDFRTGQQDIDA